MKSKQVISLLNSLKHPFHTTLNTEVFDKNGHALRNPKRPQLLFRGGEFGKLFHSLDPHTKTYIGDSDYNLRTRAYINHSDPNFRYCEGYTLGAYSLIDAIGYSLRRSLKCDLGGRYNPVTGDLMEQYSFGFPYLIAIDTRKKQNDGLTEFNRWKPGELVLHGPIDSKDIVLLFGFRPILNDPLNKSEFVNHLSKLEGCWNNQSYIELLQRHHDALLEDVVIKSPDLL